MRIWGNPVEFKEINVYPIRMKDCTAFYENVSCLMYEKNKIQDVRVIKMTYLDFLFALMQQDEGIFKRLENLLKLVLRNQPFNFMYSDSGSIFLSVYDVVINGYEFENLKKIILDENKIKISEDMFDSELEQSLREAEEFKSNREGTPATLEERIVALHCISGISTQDISKYTVYQFNVILERFSIIKNFDTYSALMAENGASKDIAHWLSHIEEKDRYADVIMTKDEFDKITADNGIINK